MKVAIVVADITSTGGIERAMSRVSDILSREGYQITIISLFKANASIAFSFNPLVKIIYLSERKYATSKQGGIKRLLMLVSKLFKFRKYLQSTKNEFELFIGCGFPINLLLYLSGLAKKSIATEHTYYNYYSGCLRVLRNLIYKNFKFVTTLTNKDAECFRAHGLSNCYKVPNPITFSCESKSDLTSKRIISVGRLSPEKGFEDLIDIMSDIHNVFPDWTLHIYGEGHMRPILDSRIKALGLQNTVFLNGNSTEIKKEYLKSSLFVLSSKFEGFGMVIIEAAVCGLPIISYDCPNGPGEILDDNKGILIPVGDKTALKEQILQVISNPSIKDYYASQSDRILSPFKDEIICNIWEKLIEY